MTEVEALAKAIAERSGEGENLQEAGAILARLERLGFIVARTVDSRPAFAAGPSRTPYERILAAVRAVRAGKP